MKEIGTSNISTSFINDIRAGNQYRAQQRRAQCRFPARADVLALGQAHLRRGTAGQAARRLWHISYKEPRQTA